MSKQRKKEARRQRAEDYADKNTQDPSVEDVEAALRQALLDHYDDKNATRIAKEYTELGFCTYDKMANTKFNFGGPDHIAHMQIAQQKALALLRGSRGHARCYATMKSANQGSSGPPEPKQTKISGTEGKKDGKPSGRTAQAKVANDATAMKGERPRAPSAKQRKFAAGMGEHEDLWGHATEKATQEMLNEFQYEKLCAQGKRLYDMVLQDKTKRLYEKLKARQRWKLKKAR